MRRLLSFILVLFAFSISSCSMYFDAFIRNMTNEIAVIDVYLLNKRQMKTLPNKVSVANRIVKFRSGYKKYMDSLQNVIWIDMEHFKLELAPNSTADLTSLAGRFLNSYPREEVRVTVKVNNKVDTLSNGRRDFRYELFGYKKMPFGTPILYYDIK